MQHPSEIALGPRPLDRHALPRVQGQRGPVGRNGLLEPRRATFAAAERQERIAQVDLARRPTGRVFGPRYEIEGGANNPDCLLERGIVAELLTLALEVLPLVDAVAPGLRPVPALCELGGGFVVGGRRAVLEPGARDAGAN